MGGGNHLPIYPFTHLPGSPDLKVEANINCPFGTMMLGAVIFSRLESRV